MKISSSHTRSWLWALAFTSTSVVAASAPDLPAPPAERALEMELALAEKRDLYLVLHLAERRLEIKARGLVLDTVALTDAALIHYTPPGAAATPVDVELPALRSVVEPDARAVRKVVTATELVPYPGDDAAESAPTAPEESTSHSPRGGQPDPEPPASYRAGLDGGWEVWIDQDSVGPALGERLRRVLVDRWRSVGGEPAAERVILGLAMPPEDGRRLHHLLDEGAILLVR